MLHKIDRDRLDKVLQVIKSVDIKFMPKKISEVTGFSKGHVSNILNGNVAMTENFYETFLKHFDLSNDMAQKSDIPITQQGSQNKEYDPERSLYTLIESNKMQVETNRDLTEMLKQSNYNKANSGSQQGIDVILLPYLHLFAHALAKKPLKVESEILVELNKILIESLRAGKVLDKQV